jgi:hypothetical protein
MDFEPAVGVPHKLAFDNHHRIFLRDRLEAESELFGHRLYHLPNSVCFGLTTEWLPAREHVRVRFPAS